MTVSEMQSPLFVAALEACTEGYALYVTSHALGSCLTEIMVAARLLEHPPQA